MQINLNNQQNRQPGFSANRARAIRVLDHILSNPEATPGLAQALHPLSKHPYINPRNIKTLNERLSRKARIIEKCMNVIGPMPFKDFSDRAQNTIMGLRFFRSFQG